ncbi:MAG: ribosomal-processing cysteine protease Prp [Clostridia bacterium]|nr:ribosomal-processing cysteine protease Prp [Clostridia bacterium]
MTDIKIYKKGDQYTRIICDGHTGYGQEGEDIVCAALSSIVQTAALGILGVIGVNAKINRDDKAGYFDMIIPDNLNESAMHDVQIILGTMMCGISELHDEYSDFIDMEVCDVL